jgi:hypothetical protein
MNRKCFSPPEPQDADPRSIEAPFPVSAVLLVTLIRRVLGDISLLPLLAQIRARRLVIGRVVFDLRSVAGTLGAAIFFRDRGNLLMATLILMNAYSSTPHAPACSAPARRRRSRANASRPMCGSRDARLIFTVPRAAQTVRGAKSEQK